MGVAKVNALGEENNTPVKFFQQKNNPYEQGLYITSAMGLEA